MSTFAASKRARDDDQVEAPPAQVRKSEPTLHPTHPYYLLEHMVMNVLPEKCRHDTAKAFYKDQRDQPDEAIQICKGMLADWVLELWAKRHAYQPQEVCVPLSCEMN